MLHLALRRGWVTSSTVVDAVERRAPGNRVHDAQQARTIGESVHLGARLWRLHDTSCVARSLLTWGLSTRRGIDADIIIGVDPTTRKAHAWVEVDGEPVDDTADVRERYLPLDGSISDRAT